MEPGSSPSSILTSIDQRFRCVLLLEAPIHQRGWRNRVVPGKRPITFSSHAGTFHASLRSVSSDLAFISTPFSTPLPLYIYLYPLYFPSFPSLFHPPLFPLGPLLRPLRANRCGQALSSKPQKGRYPPPSFAARGIRISSASRKINPSQPGDVPENGRTNGIFVKLKRKG